jgi:anti-sigma regulatory factor (Ser/Thr protein kinase)
MTDQRAPSHPHFRHEVLIHDDDASLVSATRRFVACGLEAGADVLVHSNRSQVAMLEAELGSDPHLSYGCDEEMYVAPAKTLFEYQRQLAARKPGARELWVTGTVPLGATSAAQAAWARYESAISEALGSFPLRALCPYDTRTTPPSVLAAARATHPVRRTGSGSVPCPEYRAPADFLAHPMSGVPQAPRKEPVLVAHVGRLDDVPFLRSQLRTTAHSASAVPLEAIECLILAVHEVTVNALMHGAPPVWVTVWAELGAIVVQVQDAGSGGLDPLAGYRFPDALGAMGLWVARRGVDDLIIDIPPGGGTRVLLFTS